MKLYLHNERILLILPCQGKDALSKFFFKETFDETIINYNYNCMKKEIKYITIMDSKSKIISTFLKKKKCIEKSFNTKFFNL